MDRVPSTTSNTVGVQHPFMAVPLSATFDMQTWLQWNNLRHPRPLLQQKDAHNPTTRHVSTNAQDRACIVSALHSVSYDTIHGFKSRLSVRDTNHAHQDDLFNTSKP